MATVAENVHGHHCSSRPYSHAPVTPSARPVGLAGTVSVDSQKLRYYGKLLVITSQKNTAVRASFYYSGVIDLDPASSLFTDLRPVLRCNLWDES